MNSSFIRGYTVGRGGGLGMCTRNRYTHKMQDIKKNRFRKTHETKEESVGCNKLGRLLSRIASKAKEGVCER